MEILVNPHRILYVIGNGFDKHHGLATGYHDFANYLRNKKSELYDLLITYFYYSTKDPDLWSRFEHNLANFDIDQMLDDNRDYLPDIASEDFRDRDLHAFPDIMHNMLETLTDGLIKEFTEFIRSVDFPKSAHQKKLHLEANALYFTFNYTYTLEDIYRIDDKNILHIHNAANSRYSNIILGHAIHPDNFKPQQVAPPDNLSDEEVDLWYQENDSWDYSYDTGKESLLTYFEASYKPTKKIIEENQSFFKSLHTIEKVFVLGHSLSEVDKPYIEEIINSTGQNAKWVVSYYNCYEKESHLKELKKLGLSESQLELVELIELQIDHKQLKLNLV